MSQEQAREQRTITNLHHTLGKDKIGIRRKLETPRMKNGRRLGLLNNGMFLIRVQDTTLAFLWRFKWNPTPNTFTSATDTNKSLNAVSVVASQGPLRWSGWCRFSAGRLSSPSTVSSTVESLWGDDLYFTIQQDETKDCFDLREETMQQNDSSGMTGGLAHVLEQGGRTELHDEDPNSCLWRAVLAKSKTTPILVLSFHHLITDGMGPAAVLLAIIEENGAAATTTIRQDASLLPPPMEGVLDTVPRLSHLLVPVLLDRFQV